jgi:hypothetical protein
MFLLTLPNSELAGVDLLPAGGEGTGLTLVLRFAAAFGHRDDGVAGYLRPVALRFRDARWQGDDPALCLGGLAHGTLQVGGRPLGPTAYQVPVPAEAAGEVVAELRLISGTTLRIVARQVEAHVGADAVFHESFAC